jgi:hypothetical protein
LADHPQLHGTVGKRSEAQRNVRAFPDEIDTLVGQAEIDSDVGMAVLKGKDQPADVPDAERRCAGDMNRAGRGALRAPRLVGRLFNQAQDLDDIGIVATAFLGERDAGGSCGSATAPPSLPQARANAA